MKFVKTGLKNVRSEMIIRKKQLKLMQNNFP